MPKLYETDFAEWSERTAELLRAGRFDEVDIESVAEEIEDLGQGKHNQLESRSTGILEHLLKLRLTSGPLLEDNQRGWRSSIRRHQIAIRKLLKKNPSLRNDLTPEMLQECYADAAGLVAADYDVKPPAECPFGWAEVLPPDWNTPGATAKS